LRASVSGTPGTTFGRVAEAYARTRPPYSTAVVDFAAQQLGLDAGATVLDLAAGTGKLTQALRERFVDVIAVEPDDAMRAFIDGDARAGRAEAIPLADDSVDAVFVSEAFHWFDYERALAEIQRVLRSGGGLAVLQRDWGNIPAPLKGDLDEVWARFHGENREFPSWHEAVRPNGPEIFVDALRMDGRDLVDLWLTGSTPASISDREREAIALRAYPLLDGEHELRVETELYWKRFA
jgi:SAM-dependent methyltransferase